jgi:hypothetical protein
VISSSTHSPNHLIRYRYSITEDVYSVIQCHHKGPFHTPLGFQGCALSYPMPSHWTISYTTWTSRLCTQLSNAITLDHFIHHLGQILDLTYQIQWLRLYYNERCHYGIDCSYSLVITNLFDPGYSVDAEPKKIPWQWNLYIYIYIYMCVCGCMSICVCVCGCMSICVCVWVSLVRFGSPVILLCLTQ